MQACLIQTAILFGCYVQFCGAAASSARVSKAARAAVAVSHEGSIIPDWRLDALNSDVDGTTPLLQHAEHAPTQIALGVPAEHADPAGAGRATRDGLPAAEHCHPLKLPAQVQLVAQEQTWRSVTGAWYGRDGVRLANWQRNHFRTDRVTMFVNSDVERALALEEASSKTDSEMLTEYQWSAVGEPEPALNIPILDCRRRLALVVRMLASGVRPGDWHHDIEIYDLAGALLANTLVDYDRERLQFLDPSGSLIATAEAPAINSSLTRASLSAVADPAKGNILPYEIHFEAAGYTNASQLLTSEYRWAIAVAVQSRAALFAPDLASVAAGEPHSIPHWYIALQVLGTLCLTGFFVAISYSLFRCIYPAAFEPVKPVYGYFRKPAGIPEAKRTAAFAERSQRFPPAAQSVSRSPPSSAANLTRT